MLPAVSTRRVLSNDAFVCRESCQRLRSPSGGNHFAAKLFEIGGGEIEHIGVVVDDQYYARHIKLRPSYATELAGSLAAAACRPS
jgi:hypothetical protein